ncbi:hypothetical protein V8F20_007296 [Naviculisporaceae sp. PSN 640]
MFRRVGYGHDGLDAPSETEPQAFPISDPMDIDFDLDLDGLCWGNETDHLHLNTSTVDVDVTYQNPLSQPGGLQPGPGYPVDLLFLEDEGTLPVFYDLAFAQQAAHGSVMSSTPSMFPPTAHGQTGIAGQSAHETGLEQLRHQLALLAGGSCGDELVFKDCEPSKAIAVHNLALEFGLNYTHDAKSCAVSLSRNRPDNPPPATDMQPMITPAIDTATSCQHAPVMDTSSSNAFPASDDFDLLYEKFIQEPLSTKGLPSIRRYELTESYLPANSVGRTTANVESDSETAQKKGKDKEELDRQPSRSERIGRSISKHVSGWGKTVAKGGRRGPLTQDGRRDMKLLEEAGGACWRCRVLRRKCDAGTICRCCLQSVATPSVGEDAPLWPIIGCRRGKRLSDAVTEQVLCPKSRSPRRSHDSGRCGSFRSRQSVDSAYEQCLLAAESQRFADMKAVLEGASDKISISEDGIKHEFVSFVEEGRYRNQECLSSRKFTYQETSLSYSDLIAAIAWELAENKSVLSLLEIRSWKTPMTMLETASIYEAEVGQTSLVMISMICLNRCLQALRLISAGLLLPGAHDDCSAAGCEVHCIRELLACVRAYIDELSAVMFNKENMRDRRWWLSTFYSLCIQSYVRHSLLVIEKHLCFPDLDDVPAEDLTGTQYLHLAAVLFTAASAKYDPLLGGQYQYALTDNSVIPETSIPELHHSSVRAACEVDTWAETGIKSSYQFLRRLLQIGSLDFDDLRPQDVLMDDPDDHTTTQQLIKTSNGVPSGISSPAMSTLERSIDSSHSYAARSLRSTRASFDSRYSFPSITSMSNQSEESVAKTFVTDITSIYDVPLDMLTKTPSMLPGEITKVSSPSTPLITHGMASPTSTSLASMNGPLSCSCCPKSPRSFQTIAELRQHEAEKPHACSHHPCKMRFKSPKETERHINAIHLKSDYWTCEVLRNPLLAFHAENISGSTYDVCGFCGGDFERKPPGLAGSGACLERDEKGINIFELISHLDSVHRRGECNLERKFYRVDNFRTHLKTAHVAKAGKWLKILERNCRSGTSGTEVS